MRRTAAVLGLAVVVPLLAAGCGDVEGGSRTEAGEGLPVRVRGTVVAGDDGGPAICPGGEAPCWDVEGPGLDPIRPEDEAVVEGHLVDGTLHLDRPASVDESDTGSTNPCGKANGTMQGENGEDPIVDGVRRYADTIPDESAGLWLGRPGPVVVLAVTHEAGRHQRALRELGLERGVCVTDKGYAFTEAELRRTQTELHARLDDWAASGWHFSTSETDIIANRVRIRFDQTDPRLRREIEDRWPRSAVALEPAIEVLEGTVADLPPLPAGDIQIATRTRGGSHLEALGTFTLRYDADLDCLYLEVANGNREKPIWPFGARALRDPVRVVGGDGKVIATVDEQFQMGGGNVGSTKPDDPLACGATDVWVT